MRGVNVVKGVKCCFHMPNGRFFAVRRKEWVNSCKIGTSGARKPTYATDMALVGSSALKLGRRIIVIGGRSNWINWDSRAIKCSHRSWVVGVLKEALEDVRSKTWLVEMNHHWVGSDTPRKMNAKKPFNNAHKINFAAFSRQVTETRFNGRIFQ